MLSPSPEKLSEAVAEELYKHDVKEVHNPHANENPLSDRILICSCGWVSTVSWAKVATTSNKHIADSIITLLASLDIVNDLQRD